MFSKKIPAALILCLVLLLATDAVVRRHIYGLTSISYGILHYKDNIVKTENLDRFNGIFMGDSRILGLHAKEISDVVFTETGKRYEFFNYSFPQSGVQSYYLLLKKYLKYQKAPKVIVFMSSPIVLTGEWNFNKIERPFPIAFYCFSFLYSLRDTFASLPLETALAVARLKLENAFALIAYRAEIRKFLQDPSTYEDRREWLKRSMTVSNGGALMTRNVPPTVNEIKGSTFFTTEFKIDADSVNWYKKFFALALKHNIQVIIANAPLIDLVYAQREATGANVRYSREIMKFKKEFPHIHIIDPLVEPYGMEYFGDVHHLNREGFKKFTGSVGKRIAALIGTVPSL